jgi:hypothetical protein
LVEKTNESLLLYQKELIFIPSYIKGADGMATTSGNLSTFINGVFDNKIVSKITWLK